MARTKKDDATKTFVKEQIAYHGYLKRERSPYDSLWTQLCGVHCPELLEADEQEGYRFGEDLYDGEGALSLHNWSKGIVGHMVYDAPWFRMNVNVRKMMEEPSVVKYTEAKGEQIFQGMQRTNFKSEAVQFAKYAGVIGGCLIPLVDERRGRVHFYNEDPWKVWYELDAFGEVYRVHREITKPIRAWADLFGKKNLSKQWQKSLKNPQTSFSPGTLLHCWYVNPEADRTKLASVFRPYASCYIDQGNEHLVNRSGTNYLPMIWRVARHPRWTYPLTPAMFALTDVLGNDQLTMALQQSAQRAADPRYAIHDTIRDQWSENPGATFFVRYPEQLAEQLDKGVGYVAGKEEREYNVSKVHRWFSIPFFTMLSSMEPPYPTAYQMSQVMGEKATLLGPEVGSFERDALNGAIDVVGAEEEGLSGDYVEPPQALVEFMVEQAMKRAERMNIDPGIVSMEQLREFVQQNSNVALIPEYTGLLAQIQKQTTHVRNYVDALGMLEAAQRLMPNIVHILKPFEVGKGIMKHANIPQDEMNTKREYDEAVRVLAESQLAQLQAERAQNLSKAHLDLSKAEAEAA